MELLKNHYKERTLPCTQLAGKGQLTAGQILLVFNEYDHLNVHLFGIKESKKKTQQYKTLEIYRSIFRFI